MGEEVRHLPPPEKCPNCGQKPNTAHKFYGPYLVYCGGNYRAW